jgi:hypothetical protein
VAVAVVEGEGGRGKAEMHEPNDASLCTNSTKKFICDSCNDKNHEVMSELS